MSEPYFEKAVTVRFTARAYERVRRHLFRDENEEVCFLFAHVVEGEGRRIFLVDHVLTVDPACYLKRSRIGVVVDPRAKNCVYARFARRPYSGLVNCHSHPFEEGRVCFSETDDTDDLREMAWQVDQLPVGKRSFGQSGDVHALAMVFGQNSLDCRFFLPGSPPSMPTIDRLQVLGETYRVIIPTGNENRFPELSCEALEIFDRQIRAFGEEGQIALRALRVCLVGAGGIGSVIAEGLIRLGVNKLTLIDNDTLAPSNLNRWLGGRPGDCGKAKVDVLAGRLRELMPGIAVTLVAAPLTAPEALVVLKDCDILIGAVDNHVSRFCLNRLSVQYLIPYLDAASVIKRNASDNRIELLTRMGVVVPGTTACLDCSRVTYYDKKSLLPHLYDKNTRERLERLGYIEGHPEMEAPSVMPLNMQAGSLVLTELLNLGAGFAPLARYCRTECLSPDAHIIRADYFNFPEGPAEDCFNCSGLIGKGDSEPLPQAVVEASRGEDVFR